MGAVVYDLVEYAERRRRSGAGAGAASSRPAPAAVARGAAAGEIDKPGIDFCFWRGISGNRYVHHVYSLIGCPQVSCANYILVGLDDAGQRKALHIGCVENEAQSLNLADIRQRGASLGASEVHVHLLADDADERELVALDIAAALAGASSTHSRSA